MCFLSIHLIHFIYLFGMYSGEDSICFTNKSFTDKAGQITSYIEKLCCPHYERITGKCIACKKGFTSEKGSVCHKCSDRYFGFRCLYECNCPVQSCNHIKGCLIVYSTDNSRQSTLTNTTEDSTSTSRVKITHPTIAYLGIITTEAFIYSLCGTVTFIFLCFSIIYICVHKKNQKAYDRRNIANNQHISVNNPETGVIADFEINVSQNDLSGMGNSHDYDEIDERHMSDLFTLYPVNQRERTDNDNSSESLAGITLPNDGYLNPYQPLQFRLQQSNMMNFDLNEYELSSNMNRAYTNLYEPLKPNREDSLRLYSRYHSVQYFKLVDVPIKNEIDPKAKELSKRQWKTL